MPHIVSSGINPSILEYVDVLVMGGITQAAGLDLGVPDDVKARTLAYLVVVLEGMDAGRVDEDVERLGRPARGAGRARRVRAAPDVGGAAHRRPGAGVLRRQGGRAATTSSTPSCRGPPSPTTWPRWPCWRRSTAPSSPAAATSATATSTSPSSSPTTSGGTPSCTRASSWRWPSGAPSRASTASGRRSCPTSWRWRTRCHSSSCAPSSGPSTPRASSGPDRLLGVARTGAPA